MKKGQNSVKPHHCNAWELGEDCRKCKNKVVGRYVVETDWTAIGGDRDVDVYYGCEEHLDLAILHWAEGGERANICVKDGVKIVSKKLYPVS